MPALAFAVPPRWIVAENGPRVGGRAYDSSRPPGVADAGGKLMRRHIPGVLRLRAESGADVRGRGKGSGGAAGERTGGARGRMRHLLFPAVVAVGTTGAVTAVSVAIAAAG